MKVDIIMPTYNGSKWICDAVESVINQSYTNWHLFIIDDNSPKQSFDLIKKNFKNNMEKITLIKLKDNKGAPGARMEGIKKGDGEIISFIDQDDLWNEDKLKYQIERFNEKPNVDIVHTDIEIINSEGQIVKDGSYYENEVRKKINYEIYNSEEMSANLLLKNSIRIGSVAISRKGFEMVGGFDTSLFGGEEWEFWTRSAAEGLIFSHIERKLAYRRVHDNNVSKEYYRVRSKGLITAFNKLISKYKFSTEDISNCAVNIYSRSIISEIIYKDYNQGKKYLNELLGKISIHKLNNKNKNKVLKLKLLCNFKIFGTAILKLRYK